jgi:hypothetical protein
MIDAIRLATSEKTTSRIKKGPRHQPWPFVFVRNFALMPTDSDLPESVRLSNSSLANKQARESCPSH